MTVYCPAGVPVGGGGVTAPPPQPTPRNARHSTSVAPEAAAANAGLLLRAKNRDIANNATQSTNHSAGSFGHRRVKGAGGNKDRIVVLTVRVEELPPGVMEVGLKLQAGAKLVCTGDCTAQVTAMAEVNPVVLAAEIA